ncbi:sugar transferase [Bacillus sp. RG28]|uniref:Sugar transferase n=1 Tax=Gottfriedia endophytica TaxID=2820819 RepID=A0A940NN47_9BACI|nr:sugar transferase [Gottfriedia endophytica]MBP0724478.1 sugar transferase [Gottfriedia endophytica]
MKRVFDFFSALCLLFVISPILLIIAVAIRFKMGSPILFKQLRAGMNGKPFYIYKFRTMTNSRDSNQELLSDEKRLTFFGKFIRRHSLDELPQLFNVIKGDMSFVGPRPLLMEYMPLYNQEQLRRFEVRPGITGWSQINGRNAISWSEKFKLDIWYIDHRTFLLDIKIILITILRVFLPKDINQHGKATYEKFKGNKQE